MDFSEVLKTMRMGNKVSRELWRGTVSFWVLKDDKIIAHYPNGRFEPIYSMILDDILATDWWVVT
jgi:hypothetical protein